MERATITVVWRKYTIPKSVSTSTILVHIFQHGCSYYQELSRAPQFIKTPSHNRVNTMHLRTMPALVETTSPLPAHDCSRQANVEFDAPVTGVALSLSSLLLSFCARALPVAWSSMTGHVASPALCLSSGSIPAHTRRACSGSTQSQVDTLGGSMTSRPSNERLVGAFVAYNVGEASLEQHQSDKSEGPATCSSSVRFSWETVDLLSK